MPSSSSAAAADDGVNNDDGNGDAIVGIITAPELPTVTATAAAAYPPKPPPLRTPTTSAAAATTNNNAQHHGNDTTNAAAAESTVILLKALRDTRAELDLATSVKLQADNRCALAQRAYDHCVNLLSGYDGARAPLETDTLKLTGQKKKCNDDDDAVGNHEKEEVEDGTSTPKRFKKRTTAVMDLAPMIMDDFVAPLPTMKDASRHSLSKSTASSISINAALASTYSTAAAAAATTTTIGTITRLSEPPAQQPIINIPTEAATAIQLHSPTATLPSQQLQIPNNPLHHPPNFSTSMASTSPVNMSSSTLQSFRHSFYHTLTKGAANASTIHNWQPPPSNANLKSHSQLQEWIHVVQHWNTGANGMDVGAFRAKYKTFYSRMKPASCNLGRRTGMHLRNINNNINGTDGTVESDGAGGGGEEDAATSSYVLCRYNKAGNKSIMYLDVGRVS